jgi:hypothetical protein
MVCLVVEEVKSRRTVGIRTIQNMWRACVEVRAEPRDTLRNEIDPPDPHSITMPRKIKSENIRI